MPSPFSLSNLDATFLEKIETISGEAFKTCMQCGTCSVVCPMVEGMELTTRAVMHLTQWGQKESLVGVNSPWVCASCHNCEVQCPRGIDIPRVMEAIRQITLRDNENHVHPGEIDKDRIGEMPQIALVSTFRKHTA